MEVFLPLETLGTLRILCVPMVSGYLLRVSSARKVLAIPAYCSGFPNNPMHSAVSGLVAPDFVWVQVVVSGSYDLLCIQVVTR